MSPFQEKISAAVSKKEALFDESLGRYALRSMYAGAYLTMSTAVGIIGADVIASQFPSLSRFVFTFIFAIGLVFVLIFGGELATSNMMYLTTGAYYKQISWKKVTQMLLYCTFFNFVGATILACSSISPSPTSISLIRALSSMPLPSNLENLTGAILLKGSRLICL